MKPSAFRSRPMRREVPRRLHVSQVRRILGALILAGSLVGLSSIATASDSVLWYSGDPANTFNGILNDASNFNGAPSQTYERFTVSGTSWNVDRIWTTNLIGGSGYSATTASWEIRTGVSVGNAGTLLYSGTSPDNEFLFGGGFSYFTDEVDNLNLTLAPGTYWLSVAPVNISPVGNPYNAQTFGANKVSTTVANDALFTLPSAGFFFKQTGENLSMGVAGNLVPEPSTFAMLALDGIGLIGCAFRRRRFRARS